ncbi:MAG: type II toxin-antitoxin system prevent-host-death family antitoxin [Bacteroidota bacterium]
MEITTYSNFRQNLKSFLDMVLNTRAPLFVSRAKGEDVVVISKSDYESMQETLYLLSSSKNAERLFRGIKEYKEGKGEKRELLN